MAARRRKVPETYERGFLHELDSRTALAQEMRARFRRFTDDLGGLDTLSYAQRSLVERALWLEYWLTQQEQALAMNSQFDVGKWTQAVNALQGLLFKLGLERKTKDVNLADFLAQRAKSTGDAS